MLKKVIKNKAQMIIIVILLTLSFGVHANRPMNLEDATMHVRESTKGKILSAKTTVSQGQKVHRIQVLTQKGRVKIYRIPAQNGSQSGYNRPRSQPQPRNNLNSSSNSNFHNNPASRSNYRDNYDNYRDSRPANQPARPVQSPNNHRNFQPRPQPNVYRPMNQPPARSSGSEKKDK